MFTRDAYLCRFPFEPERVHAAAIYCSDGRFGEHFDDFLHRGLSLPNCDRLVVPGGPARLVDRFAAVDERRAAGNDLRFLVEAHGLERVVLIAHSSCAYYTTRLDLALERLESVQRSDLAAAVAVVRAMTGLDRIEAYFARTTEEGVLFDLVES